MCAGAHAWSEIGNMVFLSSSQHQMIWREQFDLGKSPINFIASRDIMHHTNIRGPFENELLLKIKQLHLKNFHRIQASN